MSNPEQAAKCIEIAQKAMDDRDWSKAERFLEKSMKFEMSKKAQNMLYTLDTRRRKQEEEATAPPPKKEEPAPEPQRPQYTQKQVELCKEIIRKKNYYEILGVEQKATEDDIKKSYKKLAIKFHPDKNRAPQASDAFKKVSAAYACLVDGEKRRMYDLTGEEPGNNQSAQQSSRSRFRQSHFEQEVNPEEIFNMFFGGDIFGTPRRAHQQQAYQRRQRQ